MTGGRIQTGGTQDDSTDDESQSCTVRRLGSSARARSTPPSSHAICPVVSKRKSKLLKHRRVRNFRMHSGDGSRINASLSKNISRHAKARRNGNCSPRKKPLGSKDSMPFIEDILRVPAGYAVKHEENNNIDVLEIIPDRPEGGWNPFYGRISSDPASCLDLADDGTGGILIGKRRPRRMADHEDQVQILQSFLQDILLMDMDALSYATQSTSEYGNILS